MAGQTPAQHDRFAIYEQETRTTDPAESQGAAIYAEWCLRACRAELDDPEPKA